MKRLILTSTALLLTFCACAPLMAQAPPRHTTDDGERCYVIPERTGLEVNCTLLPSQQEVNNRIAQLQRDNTEAAKVNKPLEDEIKKLTGQLAAKKRELAAAKEDTAKAEAQKQADDLSSQIADKRSQIRPYVTWGRPVHFSRRADADRYIERAYAEAQAEKDRAAKRETGAK